MDAARQWASYAFARWRGRDVPPPAMPLVERELRGAGLAQLVHVALKTDGDDRAAVFASDYRHSTTASLIRLGQVGRIRDALETAGIPVVLLKGGAFLVRFGQGDVGLRPMSDSDLLVARPHYERAAHLVRTAGFHPPSSRFDISAHAAPGRSFIRPGGAMDVEIDLHWALAQWPVYTGLTRGVLANHDIVEGWRVPTMPDALALASIHRSRHAFAWSCLDLWDARTLVDAMDDEQWRACLARLRWLGAIAPVYATYRQAIWALGDDRERDRARLDDLASMFSRARRRLLDRIAPADGAFSPSLRWDRPLARNMIVQPVVSGAPLRSLVAGLMFLPLRTADEWTHGGRAGTPMVRRLVNLLHHAKEGARKQT